VSFYAFGIYEHKSCMQNVDEIEPKCQFHKEFTSSFFIRMCLMQLSTYQVCYLFIWWDELSVKSANKTLMKLTAGGWPDQELESKVFHWSKHEDQRQSDYGKADLELLGWGEQVLILHSFLMATESKKLTRFKDCKELYLYKYYFLYNLWNNSICFIVCSLFPQKRFVTACCDQQEQSSLS